MLCRLVPAILLILTTPVAARSEPPHMRVTAATQRAVRAFNSAKADPLALHAFLVRMPKGGDLHMHLSGAVYAETFLSDAIADNLCVDTKALALVKVQPPCASDQVPASYALTDQKLYDALIDSFSMRGFVPTPGISGHDQFFNTFARFGGLKDHAGEWLDEVATRAEWQNEQYLEVMQTPAFSVARQLGASFGWPAHNPANDGLDITGTDPQELAALRNRLLSSGLREDIAADQAELTHALAERQRIEHCGTPAALPACSVKVRFLYQILRANAPAQVFAQTLLGFEVASADPDVVGINFVQPEDARLAMAEYTRQMRMLDFLHSVYPKVHISLHAGELAPGLIPPDGLRFHIRQAITLGHAERIGHGVDVMYEDDPANLLQAMAAQHIMVEINLTSNDGILGVSLNHHSLPAYRAAHVPVALSTDDEGVSRIDLTHEYVRAVLDQHLSYADLKTMARTSLEHSFLPGASLWAQPDVFAAATAPCGNQALGSSRPTPACAAFLRENERAAEQWELERRYLAFEVSLP